MPLLPSFPMYALCMYHHVPWLVMGALLVITLFLRENVTNSRNRMTIADALNPG